VLYVLKDYLVAFTAGAAAVAAASAAVVGVVLAATCTMLRAAKCPKLESRESVMMFYYRIVNVLRGCSNTRVSVQRMVQHGYYQLLSHGRSFESVKHGQYQVNANQKHTAWSCHSISPFFILMN
jgi:hypothetical protein